MARKWPWPCAKERTRSRPCGAAQAGLVGDYYAPRVAQYTAQGVADAKAGRAFDAAAVAVREATLAFRWQTDFGDGKYPTQPVGDPVVLSSALRAKYAAFFATCA